MALLLWLQARGRATAAEAAAELEVSVRTVYRDVAALQAAGVPLWTETGPGGGIRLLEGWRTRLDGLTAEEAAALFLGGAPAAVAELGLGTVLAAAQAKVLAALPPELRSRAARVAERFHLDAPGWFHHAEPLPFLPVLAEAVWAERRVRLRYGREGSAVEREVDPLGLVVKAGTWYLVAAAPGRAGTAGGSVRTYRVGRVLAAAATPEACSRPAGFDLARWWSESSAAFSEAILRTRVRLRLSPRARGLLPHLVDAAAATRALAAAGPAGDDGWCEVVLAVESEAVALEQLSGLGPGVEVVDPPALRAALAGVGRAVAERNA